MLYHFQLIASYLSEVADFNLPTCNWHPHWGDTVRILCRYFAPEN